jgi:hypothetical protein
VTVVDLLVGITVVAVVAVTVVAVVAVMVVDGFGGGGGGGRRDANIEALAEVLGDNIHVG